MEEFEQIEMDLYYDPERYSSTEEESDDFIDSEEDLDTQRFVDETEKFLDEFPDEFNGDML